MLRRRRESGKLLLFAYFLGMALVGSVVLALPVSWRGTGHLSYLDALFTAVSAVCVTGLISVSTASYTPFGQAVILFLIQAGGLGIITFATILLLNPSRAISLARRRVVTEYYVSPVESDPRRIVRQIVVITMVTEAAGALLLFAGMGDLSGGRRVFTALFHAVSAFCNAGFSVFPENLENYAGNPLVEGTVMGLVVLGGLGFVVLRDLARRLEGKARRLNTYTRIVLVTTGTLILGAALAYWLLERGGALRGLSERDRLVGALFQAVTPRTAGFNTVDQQALTVPSKLLTMLLMFVGGGAGSTAGGVKVSTFFVVGMIVLAGTSERGELRVFGRKLAAGTTLRAATFTLRAGLILFASILCLSLTEIGLTRGDAAVLPVVFESVSAFGTVGLSLGLTAHLSAAGKVVIILTMFAGRIGLLAMAVPVQQSTVSRLVDYPEEEVLLG